MKEKCFAERRDGKCHALVNKECEHCSFYTPRSKVKNNVFYKWSWDNNYRAELERKRLKIDKKDVMQRRD